MNSWAEFFATVDDLSAGRREEYVELLRRNFAAAGAPMGWPGFGDETPRVQKRLALCYQAWSLRDVEWIALKGAIRCMTFSA